MSNKRRKELFLQTIRDRAASVLEKYDEDKVEGRKYLMRLLVAQMLRSLAHVKLINSIKSDDEDPRARVAVAVSSKQAYKMRQCINAQKNFLLKVLDDLSDPHPTTSKEATTEREK